MTQITQLLQKLDDAEALNTELLAMLERAVPHVNGSGLHLGTKQLADDMRAVIAKAREAR